MFIKQFNLSNLQVNSMDILKFYPSIGSCVVGYNFCFLIIQPFFCVKCFDIKLI